MKKINCALAALLMIMIIDVRVVAAQNDTLVASDINNFSTRLISDTTGAGFHKMELMLTVMFNNSNNLSELLVDFGDTQGSNNIDTRRFLKIIENEVLYIHEEGSTMKYRFIGNKIVCIYTMPITQYEQVKWIKVVAKNNTGLTSIPCFFKVK